MASLFHTLLSSFFSMLALLLCICLSVESAIIPSITTDKEALISFKEALLNGPQSLSWDQNSSPCSNWTGVVCRNDDQSPRVVGLDLSSLGLTVSLLYPLYFVDIYLIYVAYRDHKPSDCLSGIIASELGLLNNLKELDLSGNKFTGTVDPSIYNITSLVLFTVASNQLWGEIPKDMDQTLPNILYYRNCFNLMTGNIPASLHNITKIRSIRMSNNFLEGTVPPGLGNEPDLEMYNIGFN
ncbi:hypothetical protein ACLB2K_031149 [Fragaria x ananassa]